MAEESFGSHIVIILSSHGNAGAEEEFLLLKQLHGVQCPLKHTVTAAVVGSRQFSFKTDDRNHIEVVFEELRIGCSYECTIGEDWKDDVLHFGSTF